MRILKSLSFLIVVAALSSCSRTPAPEKKVADESPAAKAEVEMGEVAVSETPDEPASETVTDEPVPAVANSPIAKPITPQVWARLHRTALQPGSPEWRASILKLQTVGDGFTLEHFKRIKIEKLNEDDRELLQSSLAMIDERVAREDEQTSAELVLPRLERAAYCDLTCNPLETVLVQWTLTKLRSQAHLTQVRAKLEEIGASYKPEIESDHSDVEPDAMFGAMSERVPLYVSRVLGQPVR